MQTVFFSILIAAILLLILPLRVRFFLDIEADLVASIKIEFVFVVKKNINLLAAKSKKNTSGLFTMKTAKLMLDVFYLQEIDSTLVLSGNDIKRDLEIMGIYHLITNGLFSYAKRRYDGKYISKTVINLGDKNSFILESVVWFNLLTLGVLGVSILVNFFKSKMKDKKLQSKENL